MEVQSQVDNTQHEYILPSLASRLLPSVNLIANNGRIKSGAWDRGLGPRPGTKAWDRGLGPRPRTEA